MPPLPEPSRCLALAPFAPLVAASVCWRHAQVWLLGAMLAPGARTVTAALRVMGLSCARHITNGHRVLNRAGWSLRQAGRMLMGWLMSVMPPGATIVLGADDTVERRCGGGSRPRAAIARWCDPARRMSSALQPKMGLEDALGPGALESAGVGLALAHRMVLAGEKGDHAGTRPASTGCGQ